MSLVVQKFGGSSVADAASVKRVADRIALYARAGHQVAAGFDHRLRRHGLNLLSWRVLAALAVAGWAPSLWLMGVALLVSGLASSAFFLARQGFMIDVVPASIAAWNSGN